MPTVELLLTSMSWVVQPLVAALYVPLLIAFPLPAAVPVQVEVAGVHSRGALGAPIVAAVSTSSVQPLSLLIPCSGDRA